MLLTVDPRKTDQREACVEREGGIRLRRVERRRDQANLRITHQRCSPTHPSQTPTHNEVAEPQRRHADSHALRADRRGEDLGRERPAHRAPRRAVAEHESEDQRNASPPRTVVRGPILVAAPNDGGDGGVAEDEEGGADEEEEAAAGLVEEGDGGEAADELEGVPGGGVSGGGGGGCEGTYMMPDMRMEVSSLRPSEEKRVGAL